MENATLPSSAASAETTMIVRMTTTIEAHISAPYMFVKSSSAYITIKLGSVQLACVSKNLNCDAGEAVSCYSNIQQSFCYLMNKRWFKLHSILKCSCLHLHATLQRKNKIQNCFCLFWALVKEANWKTVFWCDD